MQFWFDIVVPKYLNFMIFSKYLLAIIKLGFFLHFVGETLTGKKQTATPRAWQITAEILGAYGPPSKHELIQGPSYMRSENPINSGDKHTQQYLTLVSTHFVTFI
jgi:hypothetical protein